ncbi:MAG: hypothetical protein CFH21_00629, partial [Alphaproteobacteria bacterium MarineAlpha5_Bin11]
EMENSPKPIASCAMPATDGMKIKTNSKIVKDARHGVMEFLLINHPLDCPICDQGGECDLQDQAMYYGFDKSSYKENKRAVNNKYMGPLISTIMTRCIHCTRCVRFSTEIAGVDDLGLLGRGEKAEITTYLEKAMNSELSGNVIDLCPVGALTNKPYEFQARPWELKKTETIDVFDAVGSNIRVDSIGKKVLRVLPRINEDINEEWINDKTRFAIDGLQKQRLDKCYIKENERFQETSWKKALDRIILQINKTSSKNIMTLSGKLSDVETIFSTKMLFDNIGSNNYECRIDNVRIEPKARVSYTFNTGIARIEESDLILLIGTNPRWEASILNARIRKSYLNNNTRVALIGNKKDLTYDYEYLGNSLKILEDILNEKNDFSLLMKESKKPMIILGEAALARQDGNCVLNVCRKMCEKFSIVDKNWNGFNFLNSSISKIGALDIGFYNESFSADVQKNIDKFCSNKESVVFLLGVDEIDMDIFQNSFVVYIGHHGDRGAHRADVILPAPAYTEKDSLYVNLEGRILQAHQCHAPLGDAKEEWKIMKMLGDMLGANMKFKNLHELRELICLSNELFREINVLHKNKFSTFGISGEIIESPIVDVINNFYMTDPISRSSKTMAECTSDILKLNKDALIPND